MDATTTAERGIMGGMAQGIDSARVLWTVTDVARECDVSRQTVYNWLERGLPVTARYQRARDWAPLFDPNAVRKWAKFNARG